MKPNQIERILSGLGYDTSTVNQYSEIRAFLLTANQGNNYHEDFVLYDSETNLFMFKKYKYRAINGRFSNVSFGDNYISLRSQTSILNHPNYPFRRPIVGDSVLVIEKNGKQKGKTLLIKNLVGCKAELDGTLPQIASDDMVIYADSAVLPNAVVDTVIPALYFQYSPVSKNNVDSYLDATYLLGIEMHSALIGSI